MDPQQVSPDAEQQQKDVPQDVVSELREENAWLRKLVGLFAVISILAIAGMTTGITVAVQQTQRAKFAESVPPKVTTVYINDELPPPASTPAPVSNTTLIITAEDLATRTPIVEPIRDRVPVVELNP